MSRIEASLILKCRKQDFIRQKSRTYYLTSGFFVCLIIEVLKVFITGYRKTLELQTGSIAVRLTSLRLPLIVIACESNRYCLCSAPII
jgi:hypothetical protein